MSFYLVLILLGLSIVVVSYFMARTEPNSMLGVRLPATYANPEVWHRTNEKAAQISSVLGLIIGAAGFLFYSFGLPESYGIYAALGLIVMLVALGIYLYFYSRSLLQKVLAQHNSVSLPAEKNVGASKISVLTLMISAVSFIIIGILEMRSHVGASLGVRVGKVFRDDTTWHKVNALGGAGNIIIGTFFTLDALRFLPRAKNLKVFYWTIFLFLALVLCWSVVVAIYAYHA